MPVYYRVKVDGVLRNDSWSDYKWNGTQYVLQTIGPVNVSGNPDYYPVHPVSELFLWMNPSLGMLMNSTNLTNGLHTIVLEFTNGTGTLIETSTPLTIMVNNQQCVATVAAPTLSGVPADTVCGVLKYGANTAATVALAYVASHPANYADILAQCHQRHQHGVDGRGQCAVTGRAADGHSRHLVGDMHGGGLCRVPVCRSDDQQRLVAPKPVRRFRGVRVRCSRHSGSLYAARY